MGRKSTSKIVYLGGRVEALIATRFKELAYKVGISMDEALRRVVVAAILADKVPGIDAIDLERRENEKWGPATPVYDGLHQEPSSQSKSHTEGQVKPLRPVE